MKVQKPGILIDTFVLFKINNMLFFPDVWLPKKYNKNKRYFYFQIATDMCNDNKSVLILRESACGS